MVKRDPVNFFETPNYIKKTITIRPDKDNQIFTFKQVKDYVSKKMQDLPDGSAYTVTALNIIQTGNKTDVADVLYSVPGCGKDTFYNYIGNNILGEEYYLNEDYLDIIIGGSFNDVISKKVLVILNESKRAKTDDILEAIKIAITREKNTIRAKGLKPRYETNYINWGALTNNWDAIKVKQGDRRFYADKISSLNKGNNKYFTNLYDEIKSCTYDRSCFDFFNTRKITVKSFQNERPITVYYKDLQERNIPITAQFLV
jgi:hypothetical protein